MDISLLNGKILRGLPENSTQRDVMNMALQQGLATDAELPSLFPALFDTNKPDEEEKPKLQAEPTEDDPSFLQNVYGLGSDLVGGVADLGESLTNLAGVPMPKSWEKYTTDPLAEMFGDAADAIRGTASEEYQAARNEGFIEEGVSNEEALSQFMQGDFSALKAPSWQAVVGTTLSSLPQMPAFVYGGGAALKGLQAVKFFAKNPKLAQFVGYGATNAALVAPTQWRETYSEAIEMGMNEEDAQKSADAAGMMTALISGATGGAGGVIGTSMGMNSGNMASAVAKGFVAEAPFEGLEEMGQSAAGDVGLGRPIDIVKAAESGALGALAGGVPGAGVAAATNLKPKKSIRKYEDMAEGFRQERRDAEGKLISTLVEGQGGYESLPESGYGDLSKPLAEVPEEYSYPLTPVMEKMEDAGYGNEALAYQDLWLDELEAIDRGDTEKAYEIAEERKSWENYFLEEEVIDPELLEEDENGDSRLANMMSGRYGALENDSTYDAQAMQDRLGSYVIPENRQTARKTPVESLPDEKYNTKIAPLVREINKVMKKQGLEDIGVKIVERMEHVVQDADGNLLYGIRRKKAGDDPSTFFDKNGEYVYADYVMEQGHARGMFNSDLRKIFIALDEAAISGGTPADIKGRIMRTLDHEKIHALRNLDLFKPKEWEALLNAAKNRKRKLRDDDITGEGETYFEWASRGYDGQSQYRIEEEAVSELIAGEIDRIGGKPRALMERIGDFFKRLYDAFTGSGYNTFESVFDNIQMGKIGRRKRGRIRDMVLSKELGMGLETVRDMEPLVGQTEEKLDAIIARDSVDQDFVAPVSMLVAVDGPKGVIKYLRDKTNWDDEKNFKAAQSLVNDLEGLYQAGGKRLNIDFDKTIWEDEKLLDPNETAYHASPKVFEKFKTDHVGSGEGSLNLGWGLYFGQDKKTGERYLKNGGSLYKVDIPDQVIGKMLDFDEEIKNQSPEIQAFAKELGVVPNGKPGTQGNRVYGSDLYDILVDRIEGSSPMMEEESREIASLRMKGRGIPGIKAMHQYSQNAPHERNYVVFDESNVRILQRTTGDTIREFQERRGRGAPVRPDPSKTFESPGEYGRLKKGIWRVQDKLVGLKDIEGKINEAREANGLAPIDFKDSAYRGEEASHGKIGEKAKEFREGDLQTMIDAMANSKVDMAALDRFLVLRHAIERNAQIKKINPNHEGPGAGSLDGNLLTDEYVKEQMAAYDMTWDSDNNRWVGGENNPLNKIAREHVDPMVQGTLSEARDGGLITGATYDHLSNPQSGYRYYAPLRGFGTEMLQEVQGGMQGGTGGTGGSMSIMGQQTSRAKGRSSEAYSPLATLVADRERTIARGVKNTEVGQKLHTMILNNPNKEVWEVIGPGHPRYVQGIDPNYTYIGPATDKLIPGKTKKQKIPDGANPEHWTKMVKGTSMESVLDANGEELIGVKINGEQHYIDIKDDRLRQSLLNLEGTSNSKIVNTLGNVNRVLSAVNTTFNPEFVIGNFFRDIQTAIASIKTEQNLDEGVLKELQNENMVKKIASPKALGRAGKTFYKAMTGKLNNLPQQEQADILEFLNAGAKADWFHSKPPEQQHANLQQMLAIANHTFKGNMLQKRNTIKEFVENGNAAVENAVRFSAFREARDAFVKAGLNRDEAVARAASMAKNMTINFNRKGESGNFLNSLYLFFNAQVQGTAVILRGMQSPTKQKIMGSIVATGAMMSMLHEFAEDDEEDGLEKVQDFVRERNMIIPNPLSDTDIKIPLPYGYNFFYQVGSNLYLAARGKMSLQKAGLELAHTFLGSFSPVGAPAGDDFWASAGRLGTPTAFTPAIEMMTNRNYFGSPIYKENMQFGTPVPDSHRTWKNSNEVLKALTQGMNELTGGNKHESGFIDVSPDTVSYFIGYGLGGMGAFGERAFMKPAGRAVKGKAPFEEWNDVPFMRRFVSEASSKPDMGAYYDHRDQIDQKVDHFEASRGNDRRQYLASNREYIAFAPVYKQAEKQLRVLRDRQKMIEAAIERNPESGFEMAERMERIQDRIDDIINRVNKRFSEKVSKM